MRSAIYPLGDISVIQGSKKASFLYTAYNLEVVLLPKLMVDRKEFEEVKERPSVFMNKLVTTSYNT